MNMNSDDNNAATQGTPTCGLVGPFAFPFQYTCQRDSGGRKSSRKSMHRLTGIKGMPLFIEAAHPPIKRFKIMLRELGERVRSHLYEIDEDYFSLFVIASTASSDANEVILDFTQVLKARDCPRYGTWKLINEQRSLFYKHFAELQRRAIVNGRYFPPPMILCARIHRINGVRIEIGFSEGFLPGNKLLVIAFPASMAAAVSTSCRPQFGAFVRANESIPAAQSLNEQVDSWATAFCLPGEHIVFAGFIRDLSHCELHHVWHALAEGDELAVRIGKKISIWYGEGGLWAVLHMLMQRSPCVTCAKPSRCVLQLCVCMLFTNRLFGRSLMPCTGASQSRARLSWSRTLTIGQAVGWIERVSQFSWGAIVIAPNETGFAGMGDLSPSSQTFGAMRFAYCT